MRVNGLGCGGLLVLIVIIAIIWNIGSCIIGKVWDGTQEVLAERHAKQEIADAKARERAALAEAEKTLAEAKAAEATRAAEAKAAEAKRAAEIEAEKRKRKEAALREEAERKEAAARHEEAKADKLRPFALQNAPGILTAKTQLESAIVEQDARIKDLAGALREFDKDPEMDADYRAICAARSEMECSLKDIRCKLEEAYLAYCRFKATPNHKEYEELMRKALEDGAQEADAATRKFEQMKVDK